MSLRRRGLIRNILKWLGILGLGIIIGASGVLAYWFFSQEGVDKVEPMIRQEVISVNREIALGQVITEADLSILAVEADLIPQGAFSQVNEVIGRKTWVKLVPKVVLREDFFYQTKPQFMVNGQEILVKKLPDDLQMGDYADIRIQFPSGHDYCVLSHKQVENLWQEKNMVMLGLDEVERLRLASAQTDTQIYEGAYLYLTIYPKRVDMPNTPVRYPVNGSVQSLYETVAQSNVDGSERSQLERALIQLKQEEKFLKAQVTDPINPANELVVSPKGQEKEEDQASGPSEAMEREGEAGAY